MKLLSLAVLAIAGWVLFFAFVALARFVILTGGWELLLACLLVPFVILMFLAVFSVDRH